MTEDFNARFVSRTDGGFIRVPKQVAILSAVVSMLNFEDGGGDCSGHEVVVDVSTKTLQLVEKFMTHIFFDHQDIEIANFSENISKNGNKLYFGKPIRSGINSMDTLVSKWYATHIDIEHQSLCELIQAADFLSIEQLLDLSLGELACRMRRGVIFKMGSIPNTVLILLLTKYLKLKDVREVDGRMREDDADEWKALLRSPGCVFEGGLSDDDTIGPEVLRWISARSIAITNIRFSREISSMDIRAFVAAKALEERVQCRLLTSISLQECPSILDDGMTALVEQFPALTSLSMAGSLAITDIGVVALANNCSSLTNLNMSGCITITNEGLVALSDHCPALSSVDVSWCPNMSDVGVVRLAEQCALLVRINMCGCRSITDVSLVAFAKRCPSLTSINLSGCRITDAGVMEFAPHCSMLKEVDLCCCSAVGDAGVLSLAQHCSALTSVNLSYCRSITDSSLLALAQHCTALTVINLSECCAITDLGVVALAQHCPGLTNVNLSECWSVTDKAREALELHCPLLESVNISTEVW